MISIRLSTLKGVWLLLGNPSASDSRVLPEWLTGMLKALPGNSPEADCALSSLGWASNCELSEVLVSESWRLWLELLPSGGLLLGAGDGVL